VVSHRVVQALVPVVGYTYLGRISIKVYYRL
jgi:hypothetical protein